MPAVASTKAAKPAPADFFARLENHGKRDIESALENYRALAVAVADDPRHEGDPEYVAELLETLRIGPADMKNDVETLLAVRANEAALMTPAQLDALTAEAKACADRLKANLEEVPKLRGKVREVEARRLTDAHARGEIGRTKASHCRVFGTAAEVERRIEAGQPTGPKVNGQAGQYVPAGAFSASR